MLMRPPRHASTYGLLILAFFAIFLLRSFYFAKSQVTLEDHALPRPEYALQEDEGPTVDPNSETFSRTLVIAKTRDEDVSWVEAELPDEHTAIYEVDNPNPDPPFLRVPQNKGREANVYINYIIENYDNLPDIVLFFHSQRWTWHNNWLLDLDSAKTIKRLNNQRVAKVGYMNTRCQYAPGCFDWIRLDRPEIDFDERGKPEEMGFTKSMWRDVFPGIAPPPVLSQPCCAQFAVTRDRIRSRPKSQYQHFQDWLYSVEMDDQISGRFFEYTWQYIFLGLTEVCPIQHSCYCDGYGVCMGSGLAMESWWDMRKARDRMQDDMDALPASQEVKKEQMRKQIMEWDEELQNRKTEAYARGEDPALRAIEKERDD